MMDCMGVRASCADLRRLCGEGARVVQVKEHGPAFAYWLFAGILMWEELWTLPNKCARARPRSLIAPCLPQLTLIAPP